MLTGVASSDRMLNGVITKIGVVKSLRYPPNPFVLIFCRVIRMNTTTAQAASTDRSDVGLLRPIRLMRLEIKLVANRAETNGIKYLNFSPIFPTTKLFAISTIISAKACLFEIFSTFRFLVRMMHAIVMIAITIQLTTSVSLIVILPSIGMSKGNV